MGIYVLGVTGGVGDEVAQDAINGEGIEDGVGADCVCGGTGDEVNLADGRGCVDDGVEGEGGVEAGFIGGTRDACRPIGTGVPIVI